MVRRVLAFLGRFLAVMLLGIMALVCAIVAITRSEPALIALLVCISSACVFIIRWITGFLDRPLPENEKNASFGAGGFLALAGTGLAVFYFILIREPARKYPVREDLQISAGVLRPAIGHNLYLERRNSPSLKLLCPYRTGIKSSSSCNHEKERIYFGKYVNVYHDQPHKLVKWTARYYEIRSGKIVITPFESVVGSVRYYDDRERQGYFWIFPILLIMMGLYMPLEYAIRRHRENRRHKMLDESAPATQ